MPRNYDSSRRQQAAQQTREAILNAAFKLHGRGILDLESLAQEADVSVATIRKHFPTREQLFEGCTSLGAHVMPMPDFDAISAIADAEARTREAVAQLHTVNEFLKGQVWTAFKLEDESPVLEASLRQFDGLCRTVAELILAAWELPAERSAELRSLTEALLGPLTFRALRHQAGLTLEQTVTYTVAALLSAYRAAQGKEAAIAVA